MVLIYFVFNKTNLGQIWDSVKGIHTNQQLKSCDGYFTLNDFVSILADIFGTKISKIKIPVWPVWFAGLICELVCRPLKIEPPIFRRRVDFFVKDRAFDISKAKNEIGFQPKVPVRKGLQITADWYLEQGLLN